MSILPWNFPESVGGASDDAPSKLWRFLGSHWLSDTQMDDMLDLHFSKILCDPDLIFKYRVHSLSLVPKILEAHEAGKAVYQSSSEFRWLRDVGDVLINVNPHWTSVIFDGTSPEARVLYGDSFDKPIPKQLEEACRWWITEHGSATVQVEKLPIGAQADGFSCGMLVEKSWCKPARCLLY
ncbi:hypothetical protein C8F01DRAFT_1245344 [Mycena amicta]|nr:hypothetical protein C8F01DRAFT_1245344 [Mycena amicta]